MDCIPPCSSVHGIHQATLLEWVATSFSRGSSRPRDQSCASDVPALAHRFITAGTTWEALPESNVMVFDYHDRHQEVFGFT